MQQSIHSGQVGQAAALTIAPPRTDDEAPDAPATRPVRLLPHHLAELRRSALSDKTIEASGIFSLSDSAAIERIINWKCPTRDWGQSLVFPFRGLDGKFDGFSRIKPGRPVGEGRKYEQPCGVSSRAYFPPESIAAIHERGHLLVIAEGEKKALAVTQSGYPCIGLCGVWNWGKDRVLIPDLAAIDWHGRTVLIIFDTDSYRNPDVNYAAAELTRVLFEAGANP